MGKYDDLFDQPDAGQAKGKYADLFDEPSKAVTNLPEVVATRGEGDGFLAKIKRTLVGQPDKVGPYDQYIPEQLSTQEQLGMEQQFSEEHPYIYGAGTAISRFIPKSWEDVKHMATLPQPSKFETEDLPQSEQLGEAWRGEHGPVEQAASIVGTALQAAPLAHLPFAASDLGRVPLRSEPLVSEPPPTVSQGPGTLAQDVSRALERRFELQPTPPEPRPELAPAPPLEEILSRGRPQATLEQRILAQYILQPEVLNAFRERAQPVSPEIPDVPRAPVGPIAETAVEKAMRTTAPAPLRSATEIAAGQEPLPPELQTIPGVTARPILGPDRPAEPRTLPSETAETLGAAARRAELEAEKAAILGRNRPSIAIGQRLHPTTEARLAEIDQELQGGTAPKLEKLLSEVERMATNRWAGYDFTPEQKAAILAREAAESAPSAPEAAPEKVQHGQFAKPGYTALPTEPEPYTPEAAAARAAQPQAPPVQTDLPESGFSTERAQKIYGEDAVLITKGKSAEAWKAKGQADTRDPYAVMTEARARGIATPEDSALFRAEHQRLLEHARQVYGTPEYNVRAQNAVDFLNASKQVAHGPASDIFRGLQEADPPRYDSPADFDNIIRERINREATLEQKATFQKVADEVRNGDRQARETAANGQEALKKYRPNEVIPFDEAADYVKKQIKDLTEPCQL